MRPLRYASVVGLALATAGCGGAASVIQGRNAEDAQFKANADLLMSGAQQQCAEQLRTSALDPIRNKVVFDANEPTPLRFLVINEMPTPKEQQALLAWGVVREKCAGYYHIAISKIRPPPSMDPALQESISTILNHVDDQNLQSVNLLTAMLYARRITFGEFNKRRAELKEKIGDEMKVWAASFDAQDRANILQKAQVAQQQADAAMAVLVAAASAACSATTNRTVQAMCKQD